MRAFAADLGIVPNTVARAYRELESEGYVIGRGRSGTFVADDPPAPDPAPTLEVLATAYLERARGTGASGDDAVAAVRRAAGARRRGPRERGP